MQYCEVNDMRKYTNLFYYKRHKRLWAVWCAYLMQLTESMQLLNLMIFTVFLRGPSYSLRIMYVCKFYPAHGNKTPTILTYKTCSMINENENSFLETSTQKNLQRFKKCHTVLSSNIVSIQTL